MGLTVADAVRSSLFNSWLALYYGLNTPPSEAMRRDINLHNATIFDKTRVLKFFMKEPDFTLLDCDTPVNSEMGLPVRLPLKVMACTYHQGNSSNGIQFLLFRKVPQDVHRAWERQPLRS